MDVASDLEAGYPAYILFCNLLLNLCRRNIVALEY
jgi:hypothetical protein